MYSQIIKFSGPVAWPTLAQMKQIIIDNGMYNGVMLQGYNAEVLGSFVDNMDSLYLLQNAMPGLVGTLSFQEPGVSWNIVIWDNEVSLLVFGDALRLEPYYSELIASRDMLMAQSGTTVDTFFSGQITLTSTLPEVKVAIGAV